MFQEEVTGKCLYRVPETDPLLRTSLITAENQIFDITVKMCNETAVEVAWVACYAMRVAQAG